MYILCTCHVCLCFPVSPTMFLLVYLPIYLPSCIFIYLSIFLFIYLYLSVCTVPVYPSLFVYLPICLPISLSIFMDLLTFLKLVNTCLSSTFPSRVSRYVSKHEGNNHLFFFFVNDTNVPHSPLSLPSSVRLFSSRPPLSSPLHISLLPHPSLSSLSLPLSLTCPCFLGYYICAFYYEDGRAEITLIFRVNGFFHCFRMI